MHEGVKGQNQGISQPYGQNLYLFCCKYKSLLLKEILCSFLVKDVAIIKRSISLTNRYTILLILALQKGCYIKNIRALGFVKYELLLLL